MVVGSRTVLFIVLVIFCLAWSNAADADTAGAYVGVSLGHAHIAVLPAPVDGSSLLNPICCGTTVNGTTALSGDHLGFKALLGTHPVSFFGAEVAYVDLGSAHSLLGGNPAPAKMSGETLFGLLYLPTPVIETFLKAGAARLRSHRTAGTLITSGCGLPTPAYPRVMRTA